MAKAIAQNPKQQFLVVSEEQAYEQELKQQFGPHVVTRPRTAWMQKSDAHRPWSMDNIETSGAVIIEALIDQNLS